MHFARRWYAYAVAVLTLTMLILSCIDNSMDRWDPDYPADNYQINPKWSAIDTNNLIVLKVYKVPFTQGSEMFDHISAYAVDTGFIDTVLVNSQLKNDTLSLCFLSTGKTTLIIDGFRPNGKHIYDTVKITVTNPYKINRNNDSFSITPKPIFETTGLNLAVEWKLNDVKPTILDPSTSFQLPATFSGAFKLTASLVDTVRHHRFTIGVVDDSVNSKSDKDTTGPAITLTKPAKDSIPTNSSSYTVTLKCNDTSGVLSVNGVMGGKIFSGTRGSDEDWDITVTGLSPNVFNTIVFTATDSSLKSNKTTLTLHIKYDPTMDDLEGPVIKHINGPADSAVVKDSIIVITDSIVDPSGLDSIYWTLNNVWAGKLTAVSGSPNCYQLRDTLTNYHINRIVIHAIDNSSHYNHDSDVVILDYNLPPSINDTAVNTKRNAAKTWILTAQSMDTDTLLWSRLSSPSSLSGSITGILPSVTFTPAANWSGVDSFYVRVNDGYWSDTGKVKISIIDVPVAPSITTQPASATKNAGQSVTFSVVVNSDVNPAPTYQWKHNGAVIANASTSSYTIGSVLMTDSGTYAVTITNSSGMITSQPAQLTVFPAGMKKILAAGKYFKMGQAALADTEHLVQFTHDFFMDSTEVTQSEYLNIMGINPSDYSNILNGPVQEVTWFDAVLYCNKLSKRIGMDTVYSYTSISGIAGNGCSKLENLIINYSKNGFRLPTEAEWEYACRGGSTTTYYWGEASDTATLSKYAYWSGHGIYPVAQKIPNPYGLYDMSGNVWEWCNDYYTAFYGSNDQIDPTGPGNGSMRIARGGSWYSYDLSQFGSASRQCFVPEGRGGFTGFRTVLLVK
jgi:formylglycine-generating enzyme required for sulfatase activity